MSADPVIVEFAGLPRSGKTTSALGLRRFLQGKGLKVHIIEERAGHCPIQNKLHPSFNLWTSLSFLREFLVVKESGVNFIIADRGLFDAHIWVTLLCQDGQYAKELEAFEMIQASPILTGLQFRTIFMFCEVETALEREFERTLVNREGRVMNKEMLRKFMDTYKIIRDDKPVSLELDTTKTPISSMLSAVYDIFDI